MKYTGSNDSQENNLRNEYDRYGDGDIPEIDTTHYQSSATNVIPDEIQRQNNSKRS